MNEIFDTFSQSARDVLRFAQEEALILGSAEIEPEHLLLGVLRDSQGRVSVLLGELDVEIAAFYEQLKTSLIQNEPQALQPEMSLSLSSKVVVARMVSLSVRFPELPIDSVLFLLVLLLEDKSRTQLILQNVGVTAQRVQTYLNLPSLEGEMPLEKKVTQLKLRKKIVRAQTLVSLAWGAWDILLALLLIFYNLIGRLAQFITASAMLQIQPRAGWYPLIALLLVMIGYGLWFLFVLPFHYGYRVWIPRRYGRQKVPLFPWFKGHCLDQSIILLSLCLSTEVIYVLFCAFPSSWWVWSTLYYGLFSLARVFYLPMLTFSMRSKLTRIAEGSQTACLAQLLERTHLRVDGFYMLESKMAKRINTFSAANAFVMYWGRQTRIVITDYVYHKFPLDELEVILAHELGHLAHRDMLKRAAWRTLLLGIVFVLCQQLLFAPIPIHERIHYIQSLLSDLIILTFLAGFYIFYGILSLYLLLIRRSEQRADLYALQVTQNVVAFKKAMMRLTNTNPLLAANRSRRTGTHPTLASRLKFADEFAKKQLK